MDRIFLSHSSKDKEFYVNYIAEKLRGRCYYDTFSFEGGEKTIDEIRRCIEDSKMHVVFISQHSLKSDWVQQELKLIYEKLNRSKFDAFFPIIIDDTAYNDVRIPEWIRQSYNLKPIPKPSLAYYKILNKYYSLLYLQDASRESIFAGRNDEMKLVEQRLNSFEEPIVKCLIVSGLKGCGRKTFIKEAIIKNGIAKRCNTPLVISLDRQMSIEDLMQQCSTYTPQDLISNNLVTMEDKINALIQIFKYFQAQHIYLVIDDNGCIIDGGGNLAYWFENAIKGCENQFVVGVASIYNINVYKINKIQGIYSVALSTLSKAERNLLLKDCLQAKKIELTREDMVFVSNLLTGFPDQIYYATDLIQQEGIRYLDHNAHLVKEYSEDKIQIILNQVIKDETKRNFLAFLAEFDFISLSLAQDIVKDLDKALLAQLIGLNIIERFGAFKEYLKLNDAVRDFLLRSHIETTISYDAYLKLQLNEITKNIDLLKELDMDEINLIVKFGLENSHVDFSNYVIPSHYLKTIIELYNSGKYKELIEIVDYLKENNVIFHFDKKIADQIYDYLCLSLARERNVRVWEEIKNISDKADYYFMRGFAFKKNGNNKDAYEMAKEAIKLRPLERAKRLLVDVLVASCDYEEAYVYAKENYENRPNNPYHLQAYFNCLLRRAGEHCSELEDLMLKMEKIQSQTAREMLCEMKARYQCDIKCAYGEASRIIQIFLANNKLQNKKYLLISLFDVYIKEKNIEGMRALLSNPEFVAIEKNKDTSNYYYFRKASYEALIGESWALVKRTVEKMRFVFEKNQEEVLKKLRNMMPTNR